VAQQRDTAVRRPLKYFLERLARLDLKNMVRIAGKISAEYRVPRILILADMVICSVVLYAGYYDYHEWDFNLMNWRERKTYLTRPQANQLTIRFNNLDFAHLFRNKVRFNVLFSEYIGRDWLDVRETSVEELEKFVTKHGRVFLKDPINLGGYGLEKVEAKEVADFAIFHARLIEQKQFLVEQFITQHAALERLAPGSVNTLRIITFFDGTTAHVLAHAFKMGAGADLDNFGQGGIQTTVYEDGLLPYGAFNKEGDKYTIHPLSGESIVGFRIPFYREAIELAETLSQKVAEVPYVGWDIAITPTGPIAIEGNYNSGVFQMKPSLSGLKTGLRPTYQAAMRL
jgi:Sugar-transfer associated ATP-grasp